MSRDRAHIIRALGAIIRFSSEVPASPAESGYGGYTAYV